MAHEVGYCDGDGTTDAGQAVYQNAVSFRSAFVYITKQKTMMITLKRKPTDSCQLKIKTQLVALVNTVRRILTRTVNWPYCSTIVELEKS